MFNELQVKIKECSSVVLFKDVILNFYSNRAIGTD